MLESSYNPGPEEYGGELHRTEADFIWVELQSFLQEQGYQLRPRFRPVWQPSWLPGGSLAGKQWMDCEDHLALGLYWAALDAIRLKDGQKVVLKIVLDNTDELKFLDLFSKAPFRDDPQNHCVPVLNVIPVPDRRFKIMVLPFLMRCGSSPFHCMPEVIDCIRQMLEGLEFLHDQNIAHRDISMGNVMMDGTQVVPSSCHFSDPYSYALKSGLLVLTKRKPRCHVAPVRCFLIDLGLSRHYPEGKDRAQTKDRVGQVRVTPEMSQKGVPYNPFKTDVFQLGLVFKELFSVEYPDLDDFNGLFDKMAAIKEYPGLDDFNGLFDKMAAIKPEDRPTVTEALLLFEEIVSAMSEIRRERLLRSWYWHPSPLEFFVKQYLPRVLPGVLLSGLFLPMRLSKSDEYALQCTLNPEPDEYTGICKREREDFIWFDLQPLLAYPFATTIPPGWKLSWLPGGSLAGENYRHCEDHFGVDPFYWSALDAIRVKDGQKVVLKIVLDNTEELRLSQILSSASFRDDSQNHCVNVLKVISFPGRRFKIMVYLFYCDAILLESIMLEGLEFMHEKNIAHGDISQGNIMMDGSKVVPSGLHFSSSICYARDSGLLFIPRKTKHRCRVAPVRYYFIDFGLSQGQRISTEDRQLVGQWKVTPEMAQDDPYNPFNADIVRLGTVFRDLFPLSFFDLDDFNDLLDDMTAKSPEDRPSAADALLQFEEIVSAMSRSRRKALVWSPYFRPGKVRRFAARHLPLVSRYLDLFYDEV
ncbi:kinase-like domain-containing protein [Mycena floridula]|nr:kinase-like domain-containing protein [Mycena floridula]